MFSFITQLFPWIRQLLFGAAVKSAGKGALRKSKLSLHAPNLLVTLFVISGVNAINLTIMLVSRSNLTPIFISAGVVTLVTAYFVFHGVRSKHAVKECVILFCILVIFFSIFIICLLYTDLWWFAWFAKLMLELLLCYAIMLTKKSKVDAAQSKVVAFASKIFRISPDGRLAKILSFLDPL